MSADEKRAKVDFKLGDLVFSGEGEQAWLAEQLSKIIELALRTSRPPGGTGSG
jgi:hypothetical protein